MQTERERQTIVGCEEACNVVRQSYTGHWLVMACTREAALPSSAVWSSSWAETWAWSWADACSTGQQLAQLLVEMFHSPQPHLVGLTAVSECLCRIAA